MPNSGDPPSSIARSPTGVFALVLLLVFSVEGAIMLLLSRLPAQWRGGVREAAIDASLLTLALAPAMWFLAVRPVRRLFEARGELLRRLFESQEDERARVARDLHDGIGQHLTALTVGLRTIEQCEDVETARERAHALRALGVRAHEEARTLARGLRPAVLRELGLVAALEQLCLDFEAAHGLHTAFRADATSAGRLDLGAQTALYRIAQEALANVARHAGAHAVELSLEEFGDATCLLVRDDGTGLQPDAAAVRVQRDGSGLAIMRERAEMLGAEFRIGRGREGGTRVEVRVPHAER